MPEPKNVRVVITGLGGPEVLQWVEEDLPTPGAGEVRVKILAAGVAFADVLMRHGLYPDAPKFPFAPGYDIVGEVDALGDGIRQLTIGQRVAALIMTGGYSRYAIIPANRLVSVPDALDPAEAVSLVLNYMTAYEMLHRVAKLSEGQRILIHAAAGGVGTAALQLGKLAGLAMFGTASKPKHELVASLGATPIDYRSESFVERLRQLAPGGVEAVLDPIGGTSWWSSYGCLRKGGALVCYGAQAALSQGKLAAGFGFATLGLMKILPDGKRASWFNVKTFSDASPDLFRGDLARLFELLSQRKIHPVIAARFPLREAARANEMLEKAQVSGKLVLLCQE